MISTAISVYIQQTLDYISHRWRDATTARFFCPRCSRAGSRRMRFCMHEFIDLIVDRSYNTLPEYRKSFDCSEESGNLGSHCEAEFEHVCSFGTSKNIVAFLKPYVEQTGMWLTDGMSVPEVALYISAWLQSLSSLVVPGNNIALFISECIRV